MDDHNPYAPSRASLKSADGPPTGTPSGITAWRNQKVLVMVPNTPLPPRCVKCNAPAAEPTKIRKVYWHHPAVYILVFVNLILYAIVAAIVRRRALVAPGLCEEHKKRRQIGMLIGWGGLVAGIGLMAWGANHQVGYIGFGILLMLVAALVGIILSRVLVARKIDKDYLWLKGCGAEFLDSLPPFP